MSLSPQIQLVQEFDKAFQKKDLALLEKCLHKDYRHITYPKSINQQPQTKDEFIKRLGLIFPNCTEITSTTHSMTETPEKVITHLTNQLKTTSGDNEPYEAIIIATTATDPEGHLKIKLIEEFGDSQTYINRVQAFNV